MEQMLLKCVKVKCWVNFDDYVNENKTEHNKNWQCTSDHPYRILIIEGSGSGKTNTLLNLIENQPDKILIKYICANKVRMKQSVNIWLLKEKMLE